MVRQRLRRILMVTGSVLAVGLGLPPASAATPALPPGTITVTFPAGLTSQATFVDEANGTAYVQTAADHILHAIDIATGEVTASIPLSAGFAGDAIDPATGTIYLGSQTTNAITVISGTTNTVTGTITLPQGTKTGSLAFDPGTGLLYAATVNPSTQGSLATSILVINPASGTVITTMGVGGPRALITLDAQHHLLYATPLGGNDVAVFSTTTNSIITTFPVKEYGGASGYSTPLLNPTGTILYVVSPEMVSSYSTSTGKELGEVFFADTAGSFSGALDSTTGTLYKSVSYPEYTDTTIEQINAASDTVTGTIPLSTSGDVALDEATSTLVFSTGGSVMLIPLTATTAITSASAATFKVGAIGTFTITAPGTPAPTFTEADQLPAGVTLSPAGTLSGTPAPGTNGIYHITITANNGRGTPVTQQFTLTVDRAPAVTYSGTIRLSKMGFCLDDRNNSSRNGAVIQVWRCNGLPSQRWQVLSDGTIRHNGLCLDASDYGITNGTKVQLWACTGSTNQKWDTKNWRINYDNPAATGKVLNDTGYGGNGTQQEIWTNTGGANQIWATS